MAHVSNRLSAVEVKNGTEKGMYHDGGGLIGRKRRELSWD